MSSRILITHDFMETYGGAERVTQELAAAFPDAPVIAIAGRPAVARRMGVEDRFQTLLPPRDRLLEHYRLLTPLFPALVDRARLPQADLVLSSSYAFAHRFTAPSPARHVCYCHSPLRFAWSMTAGYRDRWAGGAGPRAATFELLAAAMRRSDRRAARRVDRYLTQSPFTADQIRTFYGRDAEIVGAPVDTGLFKPSGRAPEDYFLLCGRLIEPYKRVGIAVEAFRDLPHRLIVAGDGPALPHLRAAAPANVEFTGQLEDRELVELMQGCRAAVFPSRDDFGLIPVEVMACGRPVVAYADGGALHTVAPGVTGALFPEQTVEAVRAAVAGFDPDSYDSVAIVDHARQWDKHAFRQRVQAVVTGELRRVSC